jgi:hypothetical protein
MLPNKIAVVAGVIALATIAHAETIYLKNGMYIVVRDVQEKDDHIEYWVAGTKYSIAKSMVVKVESGNGPAINRSSIPSAGLPAVQDLTRRDTSGTSVATKHDKLQLPLPAGPKQDERYWAALRDRITTGGLIDDMRLGEIEIQRDARKTADAFYLAGVTEFQRSNLEKASGILSVLSALCQSRKICCNGTLLPWRQ